MIHNILVPTDGSAYAGCGVRYAVALAQRTHAEVKGLHVVDVKLLEGPFLRDLSASLGTAPYVNYQGNIAMILEERGKSALEYVRKLCSEAGVTCSTEQASGIVPRVIVDAAGLCDLIVLGRGGEHNDFLEGLLGSTTEAVVRQAGVPVLVTNTEVADCDAILAAYDGSPHAQQALRFSRQLSLDLTAKLHVVSVGKGDVDEVLQEAREYLHDVPDVAYASAEGDARELIVEWAQTHDVNLIAMGAYGHSKVHEFMVGSTTTYVMNHAPCPVLLTRMG